MSGLSSINRVRTDPDSKAKLLLTEFGAEEFDQAKKARSARNKVLRRLPILGLEEGNYLLEERRLSKQFGRAPSPGDVYWGLANSTLQQLIPSPGKNAHQIKQIYWQWASTYWRRGALASRSRGSNVKVTVGT